MDKMIDLQQLYLMTLCAVFADQKLTAAQQAIGENSGRLYLMREGTTIPEAIIQYQFNVDDFAMAMQTRAENQKAWVIKYAEGLDGVLPDVVKVLQGKRLADKRKAA